MIIGELNNIIGKYFSIICDFSISTFSYFYNKNYIIKKLANKFFKIKPKINSPPNI